MAANPRVRWRDVITAVLLLAALFYVGKALMMQRVMNRDTPTLRSAFTHLRSRDMVGARKLFDESVASDRDDPLLYDSIAQGCIDANQPALAVEYGERGVRAAQGAGAAIQGEIYRTLSMAYTNLEPTHPQEKAILAARTALRLDPQDPASLNQLGYLLVDNDLSLDEAEGYIRTALKNVQKQGSDPSMSAALAGIEDSYGWLLFKQGKWNEAAIALQQTVSDTTALGSGLPRDVMRDEYYHLGAAYSRAGNFTQARNALLVSLAYDSGFAPVHAELTALPALPSAAPPSISPAPGTPQPVPASSPASSRPGSGSSVTVHTR